MADEPAARAPVSEAAEAPADSSTSTSDSATATSAPSPSRCSRGSFRPGFQIRSMIVPKASRAKEMAELARAKTAAGRNPEVASPPRLTIVRTVRNGSSASAIGTPRSFRSGKA